MFKRLNNRLLTLCYKSINQILENQITIMLYLKRECYLPLNKKELHEQDFYNISKQIENSDILSEKLRGIANELSK